MKRKSDYSLTKPAAPPAIPSVGIQDWLKSHSQPGSSLTFYVQTFRPSLVSNRDRSYSTLLYDGAINAFHDFAGRQFLLAEVTPQLFGRFREWAQQTIPGMGAGYVHAVHRVLHSIDRNLFAVTPLPSSATGFRPWETKELAKLSGEPGTVVHFFLTVYRPELLLNCSHGHLHKFVTVFCKMRACWGYDLQLKDLCMERVSEFLDWLSQHGTQPGGLRSFRAMVTAIWRKAHENGLAGPVPRLRGMKIPRQEPDAWSLDEVARLIAAAVKLDRPPIGGVPASKLWKALLLVGYWTGMRRGTLLAIRPADVDLNEGWIYATGEQMKNGRGKRFRIGADAVAAVREIFDAGRERLFPVRPNTANDHFLAIVKAANLRTSRCKMGLFHKLRRTTITHTASKVGMAAASALANHSASYVTDRYIDRSFIVGLDATEWLPAIRMTV